MNRIVINVDHLSATETNALLRDLRQHVDYADAWSYRREDRDLSVIERHTSEKLWRAAQDEQRIELSRDEVAAVWQRILNDAILARALRAA